MTLSTPVATPLRALILDDDPTFRQIVSKALSSVEGVHVVGTAATIANAQRRIQLGEVDVVTIDVVLRGESGLDLLRWIRENHRRVVSILLTSGGSAEARTDVDAVLLGAVALVTKPSGPDAQRELTAALRGVLRSVTIAKRDIPLAPPVSLLTAGAEMREVICVGSSTGGPPVLMKFLKSLRPSFDTPVLITQHMPASHIPYLAELLTKQTGRSVTPAVHGEPVLRGRVYLASDGVHMILARRGRDLFVEQVAGPEEHNCRPAVDPLFRSVAAVCGPTAVGVVMTGMGSDGALGAQALRARGAPVVIQDRESSVVWGMPGAVAALNAFDAVVPGDSIAEQVMIWTLGTRVGATSH